MARGSSCRKNPQMHLVVRAGAAHTRRTFLVNSGRAMLIGAGLAAGIGRSHRVGAASQVTIGLVSIPCYAPVFAALAQGFFSEEGLETSVVEVANVGLIVGGVTSGAMDSGLSTVWNVVPPRLTAEYALGDVVITAPLQRGCLALVVPPDSVVHSLADLRSKKVAGTKYLYGTALTDAGLNPDTDIVWSAGPAATDVLAMLQSGTFEAVQTADGYGALLEVTGQARMVAMNNMPPSENNFCCACIMMGNTVELDKPRAAAITRAMMRGSAWAEENRSETAELMRYSMTTPRGRDLSQQDMKAALAMQAFVPMAEAARPMLVDEFAQYIAYGLPVDNFTDATDLVNRIFVPVTDELAAT